MGSVRGLKPGSLSHGWIEPFPSQAMNKMIIGAQGAVADPMP
jgi:hypothetical protein